MEDISEEKEDENFDRFSDLLKEEDKEIEEDDSEIRMTFSKPDFDLSLMGFNTIRGTLGFLWVRIGDE